MKAQARNRFKFPKWSECLRIAEYVRRTKFTISGRKLVRAIALQSWADCREIVQHSLPDGVYRIVGKDFDCKLGRSEGVVYPLGGLMAGQDVPTRSLAEAKRRQDVQDEALAAIG